MAEKEEVELDADGEERLERLVDAEQQLRAEADEEPSLGEARVDLRVFDSERLHHGRVVGGRRDGASLALDVEVNGTVETFELPWPDDASDAREPLVRLCRANGVSVDRVADIESVAVVETEDGTTGVIVPPARSRVETTVVLPGGREVEARLPSPGNLLWRAFHAFVMGLLRTRLGRVTRRLRSGFRLEFEVGLGWLIIAALVTAAGQVLLHDAPAHLFIPWSFLGLVATMGLWAASESSIAVMFSAHD